MHNRTSFPVSALIRTGLIALIGLAAPATALAQLSSLVVKDLTPAFSPAIKDYKVPKTANCSLPITATLANPAHRLYVASAETVSGATRNAWVCSGTGKVSIVVYQGWTEVGRYSITPDPALMPPPPPKPAGWGKLANLAIAGMTPAFSADIKTYELVRTSCGVPVTATLAYSGNKLDVANMETASGATRNAWVCDGATKISVVIYDNWTELGRYTVNVVDPPPMDPGMDGDRDGADGNGGGTPPPAGPPAAEPTPVPSLVPPPAGGALPAPQPISAERALALLNQATFGPTAASLAEAQAGGLDRWIEMQFRLPETVIAGGLSLDALRAQVFTNWLTAPDQLRQRVTFALGQTLVVSANKNIYGNEIAPWVQMLSKYAFTNYRTLLREMSLSPAMGKYLDLANSQKAGGMTSPNENYPRELLQLFTVGLWELNMDGTLKTSGGAPIPTYTQASLKEVARALTGWTYPTRPGELPQSTNQEYFVGLMEPRPALHDTGAKTLPSGVTLPAGQGPTADLEGVIDALFNHPNVPPFVATRLIRSLVTSNPSGDYIARVANVFANNGSGVRGDMQATIRAVLTDDEAAVAGASDGHLKDSLLHIVGLARALNAQAANPSMFMYLFSSLGQLPLAPNTVFSFYSPLAGLPKSPGLFGPEFQIYGPALAIQRANFIWNLLSGQFGTSFPVNLSPFLTLAGNPAALVEQVNQTLFFGRMSTALRQSLLTATSAVAGYNAVERVRGALYLAAISGEYAVFTGGPVQ
ncbi:MAG: DUF1800 family protein [Alphaproteobacteria bacterium]